MPQLRSITIPTIRRDSQVFRGGTYLNNKDIRLKFGDSLPIGWPWLFGPIFSPEHFNLKLSLR